MHHAEFQKLEGVLARAALPRHQTETGTTLKIRVLNVIEEGPAQGPGAAAEFDQSALFKKIYEEEYGTFGGAPFGMLIGDYEFGRSTRRTCPCSKKISNVAAAAHAPFISAATPELFNWDAFTELSGPRDLAKIFETVEYVKWKSFRESRGLALRRPAPAAHPDAAALRRRRPSPSRRSTSRRTSTARDHNKYLWGNAAYALGTRITDAFASYGWCAAIRGVEGGGLVEGLPAHTFKTDDGDIALKCPTEIAITDRREKELSDLGFIPLVHCKGTDYAAFFGAQSCQKPKHYNTDAANANARLSAQLQYIFATSRFAHYLKAMMRDKIGSFMTRKDVRDVPQQLDVELRDARRHRQPGGQGASSRCARRGSSGRGAGQARRVQGRGVPAAPLPARRADRFAAPGGRTAAIDSRLIRSDAREAI